MRHKRIGWIVATGLIATVMSSCDTSAQSAPSGGGGSDPPSSSDGKPAPESSNGGSTATSPHGASGGTAPSGGFAWVPFGPADPQSPVPGDWPQYNVLAQHRCGDMMQSDKGATGDQLWRALHALCAAVSGDQAQWKVVQTASSDAQAHHFSDQCLENAARALLNRALAWRKAHPSSRPTVHFPVAATETECGKRVNHRDDQPSEPTQPTTTSTSPHA